MTFTPDQKWALERTISNAAAFCYRKLEIRMSEIMKQTTTAKGEAAKEVVESGSKTVERFSAYLRTHLGLQEDGSEEEWLTK